MQQEQIKKLFIKFVNQTLFKIEGKETDFFIYGEYKDSVNKNNSEHIDSVDLTVCDINKLYEIIDRDFEIMDITINKISSYMIIKYI